MSDSSSIIKPYYNKYDTPQQQNRFQKAVFNGRSEKVKQLIVAGENVYITTDMDESPLFMAIVRDHEEIVNEILNIYEEDLYFVRKYFHSKYNIAWTQRPIFVAHGSDHVNLVEVLSAGLEIEHHRSLDTMQTMVILLRLPQARKVLWLQPKSDEENTRLAKILECIWADGVIDLQHKGHWGRTVLDVAALRYQPEIYFRLFTLLRPEPEKATEHFLQMCRHRHDQLDFFKHLWSKANYQIDIAEILSKFVNVLVLPAYYDQIEVFQYFLESLAARTATPDNRQDVMTDILNTYKVNDSKLMETIIWADHQEFVQQCILRFKPNLLLIGCNRETVLESLIRQKRSKFMTQLVVENFDQVLASGMECKIVKMLIEQNWLDAIKILYCRYESCRNVLFFDTKKGVKYLMNAIDGTRYEMANFLIDAHRLNLTDPEDVMNLIFYCSFVERSYTVLQTLLTLPATDLLRVTGDEHFYRSPFYVALKFRHLKNFQLLMDNVNDKQGLRDLKEDNGENLLFVAIWFKENPVDETPFVYVEEEQASLEVVDSSDDEEDKYRKRVRNEQILTSSGPYKDPVMPDSYFEKQYIEFGNIFNYLLNELGLDHQCINNNGETLLHVAVKRNNHDAVKQLLSFGLDPNTKDNAGNMPLHGVCSVIVLNLLNNYKCDVNSTNLAGETPLLVYVKGVIDDDNLNQEAQEIFLKELLRVGADINHGDVNGQTALHVVKSVIIASILLENGAAINAKNKDGETPLLYVFREQIGQIGVQNLLKLFLCQNDLDLMLVSASGVSALSVLVSLDEHTMSEVLASFADHSKSSVLEDLFTRHCNSVDHHGCPVLVTACFEHTNSYCLVKLLNLSHLDVNVYPDYEPLVAAVQNHETVKRLIELGASVSGIGDAKRKTPLMHAIGERTITGYKSYFASTALLLRAGTDLEILDQNGDTALNYAARLENLKDVRRIIAALILANVNYRRTREDGNLPLVNVEPFQCLYSDEIKNV